MLQRLSSGLTAHVSGWRRRSQPAGLAPAMASPVPHRLPLALAADPSRWRQDPPRVEQGVADQVFGRDGHACRFCGFQAAGRQEVVRLDAGLSEIAQLPRKSFGFCCETAGLRRFARGCPALADLLTACPLCHDCRHLGRDGVEQGFAVIWLPEASQAVLNHLVRAVHVVLHEHGEPPHMAERPANDTPALRSAFNSYRALAGRMAQARSRIGTTSPRELGEALIGLPPAARAKGAELTGGLRLLSRGRLFRDGEDVYPDLLDAWTAKGGPCHGLLEAQLGRQNQPRNPLLPSLELPS